jgi:hypothetical protein
MPTRYTAFPFNTASSRRKKSVIGFGGNTSTQRNGSKTEINGSRGKYINCINYFNINNIKMGVD